MIQLLREALNEGRGAHPGDTWDRLVNLVEQFVTLNEGRGAHPGDTL